MAYQRTTYQNQGSKKCAFCKTKVEEIDYKDATTLSRYLNRWNKIESSGRNGNCTRHQKQMSNAVKRARHLALLPFTVR